MTTTPQRINIQGTLTDITQWSQLIVKLDPSCTAKVIEALNIKKDGQNPIYTKGDNTYVKIKIPNWLKSRTSYYANHLRELVDCNCTLSSYMFEKGDKHYEGVSLRLDGLSKAR